MLAQHLGHKITGDLTTYMEPGDAKTGHSKMFNDQDVPRLWALTAPSFFARKFATTPKNDKALAAPIARARGLESKVAGRRASSSGSKELVGRKAKSVEGDVEAAAEGGGGGDKANLMAKVDQLLARIERMDTKLDSLVKSKKGKYPDER